MNHYHYNAGDGLVRITARRRPSPTTTPVRGTWIVKEWDREKWTIPCLPEITWKILSTLEYLGCVAVEGGK